MSNTLRAKLNQEQRLANGAAKRKRRDQLVVAMAERVRRAAADIISSPLYGVIYADPPWRFKPYSRVTGMDRAAENHYPTMDTDDIAALPIPAAPDCVLFLWATVPKLPDALQVMAAWGFEYKSLYVWHKPGYGLGYWSQREQVELLLIGTRGKVPAPAQGNQPLQMQTFPRGEHSVKPEAFAQMIGDMYPTVPKLEMFARQHRDGWDCWGAEITRC